MKLVIFDIDGTLCHSNYIDDKCYIRAFKDVTSFDIPYTNWDAYKKPTEQGIIEQLYLEHFGREPLRAELQSIIDKYVNYLMLELNKDSSCFVEIPGAKNLLNQIKALPGIEIGIATGGFEQSALFKLNKLKFDVNKIKVAHSNNFKTKNEIIKDLIQRISEQKNINSYNKIFYVGDREYDYKTAMEMNIDFIGVDYKRNGQLKKLGVKNVVNDFVSVEDFIKLI